MPLGLQDALVALVALVAAVVAARRVIGFARVETSPKCANCESSACAPSPVARAGGDGPAEHPLVFVRPSQH